MGQPARILEFKPRRKRKRRDDGQTAGRAFGKQISGHDMARLHDHVSNNPQTEAQHRARALFLVMSSTGLRAREIVSLSWKTLVRLPEDHTALAFKYTRKGGQPWYCVPSGEALDAVRAYHTAAGIKSDLLFHSLPNRARSGTRSALSQRSLQRIVEDWGKELDIKDTSGNKLHPHCFRHTVGDRLAQTAGIHAASKQLGHSTIETTAKFYTRPYFDGRQYLDWSGAKKDAIGSPQSDDFKPDRTPGRGK